MSSSMLIRFWGVRGSIPCPGPGTARYGGNTPCVEVRCGDHVLIFDAGTGIRDFGQALLDENRGRDADLFFSHCHLDHIIGLPFFEPLSRDGQKLQIWAGQSQTCRRHRRRSAPAHELSSVSDRHRVVSGHGSIP